MLKTKESRLENLKKLMLKADLPLKQGATHLVFGELNPDADIVFIGEAPGKNEDLTGKPFIGSAGKILDQMLASINLNRTDIYITSILKYRPPQNRNPNMTEIISHTPYLIDQIRIIEPKVIVPLGNFAVRFVLSGFNIEKMQEVPPISTIHGKIQKVLFENKSYNVMALYHPAAVLYNRSLHQILQEDFKILSRMIK